MAQNADSVLVEVETRLNTASNKAAEAQFDGSMNRIKSSAGRAEKQVTSSMNKIGDAQAKTAQRSRLLGFQIADLGTQFASGTNLGVAFAQQMPQIANALDGTAGKVGKLATFLSGPLGAALLAVGSLMFIFATRSAEASEKTEKQTDSTKTLQDAIRDLDKATGDAIRTQEQSNRQKELSAQKNLDEAITLRAKTQALIEAAIAEEKLFIAQQGRITSAAGAETGAAAITNEAIQRAEARINALNTQLALNNTAIDQAQRALAQSQVPNMLRRAEAATDPVTKATYEYEDALQKLQNRWTTGVMGTGPQARAEFDKQAEALLRVKNAAIEAAQATKRESRSTQREIGGDFTAADARSAIEGVGGRITSGARSAQHNADVGGVANSFHLSGQAFDVAKGAGVTLNKLTAAIRAKGGRILEALDEGDHFHVAFKTGSAAAEQLARATERAADKTTRQNNAFNSEMEELQAKIVAANRPIAKSYEDELKAFEETLVAERDRQNHAYEAAAAEERITQAQAQLLIAKNNELATAQLMARYQAEGLRKRQTEAALEQDRQAIVVDQLKDEAEQARSSSDRKEAALRILDAETELQRLKLQQIVDNTKIGSIEHERAVLALQQLEADRQRGADKISRDPANRSPGENYLDELNTQAATLSDTLEGMAVDKFKELSSYVGDSAKKLLGLNGILGDTVSQLVSMAYQLLVIRPLMEQLSGGGSLFGGGGGGFLSSLFGGGRSFGSQSLSSGLLGAGSGSMSIDYGGLLSMFGGLAGGGRQAAGQPKVVGERGRELWVPDTNGTIIPNNAMANFGQGSGGPPSVVRVLLNAGEYFDARVERVSGPVAIGVVRQATPAIVNTAAAATASKLTRKRM